MLQGVAVFWYIQCLIAYQFLPSEGPHVWKVWTDDDDDALKALYRVALGDTALFKKMNILFE